jgi:hypothetical protein
MWVIVDGAGVDGIDRCGPEPVPPGPRDADRALVEHVDAGSLLHVLRRR